MPWKSGAYLEWLTVVLCLSLYMANFKEDPHLKALKVYRVYKAALFKIILALNYFVRMFKVSVL